jgi:ornithine cyclodeaminase
MLTLTAHQIRALAPMPRVVACLEAAFRAGCVAPPRQILHMPGESDGRMMLVMPAFHPEGGASIKMATVFPDNASKGLPTIQAAIVVFSSTGAPVALLDGTTVTHLRTAAASALASRYLSREDSAHLVLFGTGALAPAMVEGHCAVRPIKRVSVCGRRPERAAATAEEIRSRIGDQVDIVVPDSIDAAIATADIISCATSSATPIVPGKLLKPGTFVDLVGSFSPSKREADDDVVRRARIFVDTFEGALSEAGDLLEPLARNIITRERIEGELADLVSGRVRGRANADEIILFKSVGAAIEDLALSRLLVTLSAARPQ